MGDLWALHLIFRHCAKSTMWNLVNLLNTFLRHSLRILSFSRNSCTFFVVFGRFVQSICANKLRKFGLLPSQMQHKTWTKNRGVPNTLLSAGSMHFYSSALQRASSTAPAAASPCGSARVSCGSRVCSCVWPYNRPGLRNLFAQMDCTKRPKTTKNVQEFREKEKIRKE